MQDTLHRSEQLLVPTGISFLHGRPIGFIKLVPWTPLQRFRPPRGRLRWRDLRHPICPLNQTPKLAHRLVLVLPVFGQNQLPITRMIRQLRRGNLQPCIVLSRSPVSEPCKTYICKAEQQKEQTFIEFQDSVAIYHKY